MSCLDLSNNSMNSNISSPSSFKYISSILLENNWLLFGILLISNNISKVSSVNDEDNIKLKLSNIVWVYPFFINAWIICVKRPYL